MNLFWGALRAPFGILFNSPKLFVPKIFVAVLYGVQMLFLPSLALRALSARSPELLGELFFWIGFLFFVLVVDVVVSAMYPFLVKDFFAKKSVSLRAAFSGSLKRFFVVVPAVLFSELLFLVLILPVVFLVSFFIVAGNVFAGFLAALVCLAAVFLFGVVFFVLLPVASLEGRGVLSSLGRSVVISKKNFFVFSKATVFSMLVSLASIFLAFAFDFFSSTQFFVGSAVAVVLFVFARLATAVIATYQFVLNPVFYFEFEEKAVFS